MTRIAPLKAFEILGVAPTDDFATIRRAWVRLVKENHPDVVGGDLDVLTKKLTELNEAYDSLRWHSPEKVRIREEELNEKRRNTTAGTRPTGRGSQRRPSRPFTTAQPVNAPASQGSGTYRPRTCERGAAEPGWQQLGYEWDNLSVAQRFVATRAVCSEPAQRTTPPLSKRFCV